MRTLASARAYARKLGRRFAIVWQPDFHCNVRFADLFRPMKGVVVFDNASLALLRLREDVHVVDAAADNWKYSRISHRQREANARRHVYVWTSTVLRYAR